jgi:hypothetical protein
MEQETSFSKRGILFFTSTCRPLGRQKLHNEGDHSLPHGPYCKSHEIFKYEALTLGRDDTPLQVYWLLHAALLFRPEDGSNAFFQNIG